MLFRSKAIKLTLTRFDASTQEAFFNLYTKIDPTILPTPVGMPEQPKAAPSAGDAKLAEEIEKALNELKPADINYAVTA